MKSAKYEPPVVGGTAKGTDVFAQFKMLHLTKGAFAAQVVYVTLITVMLFSVFVAVFYFVFAAKVERRVVSGAVESFVSDVAADAKVVLSPEQAAAVEAMLAQMKPVSMAAQDAEATAQNKKLVKSTLKTLGIGAAVILAAVFVSYGALVVVMKRKHGASARAGHHYPDLNHVFRITAFTFLGVIAAEFVFLYAVAATYHPLDPNAVKLSIVDAMLKNIAKVAT